jgi:head-tail adaptor
MKRAKLIDLRTPISIEQLQNRDINGVPVQQANLVATGWASIEPVSQLRLGEDSPFVTHRITLRLRKSVTIECRLITQEGRSFKVLHARRLDDDDDLQLLFCEEITA